MLSIGGAENAACTTNPRSSAHSPATLFALAALSGAASGATSAIGTESEQAGCHEKQADRAEGRHRGKGIRDSETDEAELAGPAGPGRYIRGERVRGTAGPLPAAHAAKSAGVHHVVPLEDVAALIEGPVRTWRGRVGTHVGGVAHGIAAVRGMSRGARRNLAGHTVEAVRKRERVIAGRDPVVVGALVLLILAGQEDTGRRVAGDRQPVARCCSAAEQRAGRRQSALRGRPLIDRVTECHTPVT
jgi:hypothetical protein